MRIKTSWIIWLIKWQLLVKNNYTIYNFLFCELIKFLLKYPHESFMRYRWISKCGEVDAF